MSTARPPYSIGALPLVAALVTVFALGSASGYLVKASGTAVVGSSAPQRAVSACPAGMHAEVWYTAHAWACASESKP